jgi:hypothetical protein
MREGQSTVWLGCLTHFAGERFHCNQSKAAKKHEVELEKMSAALNSWPEPERAFGRETF